MCHENRLIRDKVISGFAMLAIRKNGRMLIGGMGILFGNAKFAKWMLHKLTKCKVKVKF